MDIRKIVSRIVYFDQVLTRVITDRNIRKFISHDTNKDQVVLNVGSGNTDYNTINIDVIKFDKVHFVAKNHELPFEDNYADKLLSIAVLEHSSEFEPALKEMFRVVKPGGKILVYLPFLYPYHVYPGQTADYYRFSKSGIMNRFGRYFKIDNIHVGGGPLLAAAQILSVFFAVLLSFGIKKLYMIMYVIACLILLPLRLLDMLLWKLNFSHIAATSFWFEGVKLPNSIQEFHQYEIEDPFTSVNKKFDKNSDY